MCGVIPNARAFISGRRDLAWSGNADDSRETLRMAQLEERFMI